MAKNIFVLPSLDKPVYFLLQRLRVIHKRDGEHEDQWSIVQAALVGWAKRPKAERDLDLAQVKKAPTDQPLEYEVSG